MSAYNEMFELSIDDMDLIETALRRTGDTLSRELIEKSGDGKEDREKTLHRIQDLLGRLHNQKIFYRPKDSVYVGG